MKNFLATLVIIFASLNSAYSQGGEDTSMHKAAVEVCDCLNKSELPANTTQEQLQQAFLSCVLTAAPDLMTQIASAGDDYEKAGAELGQKLSLELLKIRCPAFTKFATSMALENGGNISVQTEKPMVMQTAEGTVMKVEEKDFTYITVKTSAGRELTFIYYAYVNGSDDWIKDAANKLKNKKVSVSYVETEVYQPKFKEFMNVRELKSLTIE